MIFLPLHNLAPLLHFVSGKSLTDLGSQQIRRMPCHQKRRLEDLVEEAQPQGVCSVEREVPVFLTSTWNLLVSVKPF